MARKYRKARRVTTLVVRAKGKNRLQVLKTFKSRK